MLQLVKTKMLITQEPLIALCHIILLMDHTEIMCISRCITLMTAQSKSLNSVIGYDKNVNQSSTPYHIVSLVPPINHTESVQISRCVTLLTHDLENPDFPEF